MYVCSFPGARYWGVGGGRTSCYNNKYFKSSGTGASMQTEDRAVYITVPMLCSESKEPSRGRNKTKGAVITSSCCRRPTDWGGSQDRTVLDQQGPVHPDPTGPCVSSHLKAEPFRGSDPEECL